jgi:uncharacterized membrane protein YqjE
LAPDYDPDEPKIGQTVQEITERMSALVREEIELAKAEVEVKFKKLAAAAVVGAAAGIFVVVALVFFLHGAAWFFAQHVFNSNVYLGFLLTAFLLLVLAVIAGLVAKRFVGQGTPPTPELAIEEARLIKKTVRP